MGKVLIASFDREELLTPQRTNSRGKLQEGLGLGGVGCLCRSLRNS